MTTSGPLHRAAIAYLSIVAPFAEKIVLGFRSQRSDQASARASDLPLGPSTTYQFDCLDDADRIRIMKHVASSFEYVERAAGNLFMKECCVLILLDNLIATTSKDGNGT